MNILGHTFKDYSQNPHLFLELSDSHILRLPFLSDPRLAGSPREAFMALYRRPWLTRIPLTVSLRTLPYCRQCRQTTAITDIFCSWCGHDTSDRPFVINNEGLCVPPECGITATMVSNNLRGRLTRVRDLAITVHISDLYCGTPTWVPDAQDRKWRDFAPLKEVVFVTPQTRTFT